MNQNDLDRIMDRLEKREITTAEANVLMIRVEGVRLVKNSIPKSVRAALNAAVKSGELGHLKKDGRKPEAYFHPNSLSRANELRNREVLATIEALRKVCTA